MSYFHGFLILATLAGTVFDVLAGDFVKRRGLLHFALIVGYSLILLGIPTCGNGSGFDGDWGNTPTLTY